MLTPSPVIASRPAISYSAFQATVFVAHDTATEINLVLGIYGTATFPSMRAAEAAGETFEEMCIDARLAGGFERHPLDKLERRGGGVQGEDEEDGEEEEEEVYATPFLSLPGRPLGYSRLQREPTDSAGSVPVVLVPGTTTTPELVLRPVY